MPELETEKDKTQSQEDVLNQAKLPNIENDMFYRMDNETGIFWIGIKVAKLPKNLALSFLKNVEFQIELMYHRITQAVVEKAKNDSILQKFSKKLRF
jgi:hypothetical protein